MTENKPEPKYAFISAETDVETQPSKRKIAKTMEVTELFTYYDALAYCMKIEKAIEDKKAEIVGLEDMASAYRKELELINKVLGVVEEDEIFHNELHEKLKSEAEVVE